MIRLLIAPLVRLWRGIPEHVDRRLANRCDLGSVDE